MQCTEKNLLNENLYKVDEPKVLEMIDKVRNKSN